MNDHQQNQDVFFEQAANRSPTSQRIVQQTMLKSNARPFELYGQMGPPQMPNLPMAHMPMPGSQMHNNLYGHEENHARYDGNRFDHRMNGNMATNSYSYDLPSAQTWNPAAFGGGPVFNHAFGTTGRMKSSARGRSGLPNTWLDPQIPPMPGMHAFSGLAPGQSGSALRQDNFMADPDEELIPTAIVIKNIPFAIKKEQLVDLMTQMNLPLPYAFNYHFDNGVFRGLAFANFTSADETAAVIDNLNHFELQGRKLRVEYKKMLPLQERERIEREKRERRGQLEEQHRPMPPPTLHNQPSMSSLSSQVAPPHVPMASASPIDPRMSHLDVNLNDPQTLEFYTQLLLFKREKDRETMIFPNTLSPPERRIVHTLAHVMGLLHTSRGTGEQRQVHVQHPVPGSSISPPQPQSALLHGDSSRRVLNRAATTDFSEARASEAGLFGTLRGQHSTGFLGIPDSPNGFGTPQNLRAAKSFADLRSYTPSPVNVNFPPILQSIQANVARLHDGGQNMAIGTPALTPTTSEHALGQHHRDEAVLVNGLGSMNFGNSMNTNGGSPRRLRGMFSWDSDSQGPPTGPIGSNRSFGSMNTTYEDQGRDRNNAQTLPMRQPRGPPGDARQAFSRARANGHQTRGSDDLKHQSSVEIIVE